MAKKLFAGKETYKEELAEGEAIKKGKIMPKEYAKQEMKEPSPKMACGGKVKKYGSGGQVSRGHGAAVKGFHFTKNG